MIGYKLVPVEPTAEMVVAAEDAYMPFGDMDLALRMAILAAPAVQGGPTDAELLDWAGEEQFFLFCDKDDFLDIARSVLQRYVGRSPAVQGEPVGRVKTVGGYPDDSEHAVEWLCKYRDLKDGDLLYTAPQPGIPKTLTQEHQP